MVLRALKTCVGAHTQGFLSIFRASVIAALSATRLPFCHAFVSRWPIEEKTGSHDRTTQLFPLYIYQQGRQLELDSQHGHPRSALSDTFTSRFAELLGKQIDDPDNHDDPNLLKAEQIFFYIYSILHAPIYRELFGPELMEDFPRIPAPWTFDLFRALASLGGELVAMHLLESPKLNRLTTNYFGPISPEVSRVGFSDNTVWLDAAGTKKGKPAKPGTIGFRGVPEAVWNFRIGGYKVCEKWLKDRKDRTLSKNDILHYQKIIVALSETIRLMMEIDKVIEKNGGWPLN